MPLRQRFREQKRVARVVEGDGHDTQGNHEYDGDQIPLPKASLAPRQEKRRDQHHLRYRSDSPEEGSRVGRLHEGPKVIEGSGNIGGKVRYEHDGFVDAGAKKAAEQRNRRQRDDLLSPLCHVSHCSLVKAFNPYG